MAVAQMARRTLLFVLSRDPGRHIKYAKTCVAFFGITAAGGKAAECYLICKMLDKKMPTDHAGWVCLVALSWSKALARSFPASRIPARTRSYLIAQERYFTGLAV